jgi:hypothetical protein
VILAAMHLNLLALGYNVIIGPNVRPAWNCAWGSEVLWHAFASGAAEDAVLSAPGLGEWEGST